MGMIKPLGLISWGYQIHAQKSMKYHSSNSDKEAPPCTWVALKIRNASVCSQELTVPDFFFFFKILFIYLTQRERHRHRQREKQTPCREPDKGLDPGSPGSNPGPKAALNR